jgi:phage/plasmid-like protein (TIGR03299 family)
MAHELDTTTGKAAMAYAAGTAKPWHGLGQTVSADASIEDWQIAGGINWEAKRALVTYTGQDNETVAWADKHVLYRSDTGKPLSVVSKDYRAVQPSEVLGFFKDLSAKGGFEIETVGSLKEGRRIWALARVGENARVMDDNIAPYLMLATSYDGTMATIGGFTAVRIVCNNTLQRALTNSSGQTQVSIPHSAVFNASSVMRDLCIATDSWDAFILRATKMASKKVNDAEMDAYLQELIESPYGKTYSPDQVRNSKAYQRIVALFKGGQLGAGQDAINSTAWGLLQATTQYVDHEQGRMASNRLEKAWFGPGAQFKERAMKAAVELA